MGAPITIPTMDAGYFSREQEAVEGRVVLVRLAAEEGLDLQAVLPGDQPGEGGELVFPLEADQVRAGSGCS